MTRESRLPGLGLWAAVRDNRLRRIESAGHVTLRLDHVAEVEPLLAEQFDHIVVATGSEWRRDGLARAGTPPPAISADAPVLTPDDILDGVVPSGRIVVYDEDHYYMGGLVAEVLRAGGADVALVTPAAEASIWTHRTMEQRFVQRKLLTMGVQVRPHLRLESVRPGGARLACVFTGRVQDCVADAVVLVCARRPKDALYYALQDAAAGAAKKAPKLSVIGDAKAPALIAHAVRSGHRFARELDSEAADPNRFERDMPTWP